MFFPAYKIDTFTTETDALSSENIAPEDLKNSNSVFIASGDLAGESEAKIIMGDNTFVLAHEPNGQISLWFSDNGWECSELDDAEDLILSVESGIPAEDWAVFETRDE